MNFPPEELAEIEKLIESDTSPVGIDAKKTHVLILKMLLDLKEDIKSLSDRVDQIDPRENPNCK